MNRLVDEIANLSKLLTDHPDNFNIQRQLLIANVEMIQNESENNFKIYYNWSSRHSEEWQPRKDSNLN